MVWVLSRDRNEGTNGFFDCGKDMVVTNASLDVNEMWWMLLCRVIHLLGVQRLWVLALVSGALLVYVWVQKNLLLTDRTLRGMWCCVDYMGVVPGGAAVNQVRLGWFTCGSWGIPWPRLVARRNVSRGCG